MNYELPPIFCAFCDHYLSDDWWHDDDCPHSQAAAAEGRHRRRPNVTDPGR